MKSFLLILILGLGIASSAKADVIFRTAAGFNRHTVNGNTSSRFFYDLNPNFRFQNSGWLVGTTFQGDTGTVAGSASGRASIGLTTGWAVPKRAEGFYLLGTFYPYSKLGNFKGNGYQIDLGYFLSLGRLPVGFQLSYKSFSYSKGAFKDSLFDPYLVLLFKF